ncbi:signal recognition particle-docking protein FtsY [Buchnera aphidicola]|uniref:signal recognition particle-docking protein FtsY n=1 Tax=Buchnera aphidicola TaxID=9 RepID=UPI000ABDD3AA|nr:signal recognition particle-docking protein FtsY [Buchnera aphidicola]
MISKNIIVDKLKNCFLKTKKIFTKKINDIFSIQSLDQNTFDKLEKLLLLSDFGVSTTEKILVKFKKKLKKKKIIDSKQAIIIFKNLLLNILKKVNASPSIIHSMFLPYIILIIGVNGVGKTTTIAKLAYYYKKKGKSVVLSAADTFRAAAIDQINALGKKFNIPVISRASGTDPASVVFDSIKEAKMMKSDILIIDTAGRLHNKSHLLDELKKITRIIKKFDVLAPHEIILIIDSGTGQNSIQQTKLFHSNIGVNSIIATKLDGTAKGGIIFSIINRFKIPINFISTGEKITDLKKFNGEIFIEELFEN